MILTLIATGCADRRDAELIAELQAIDPFAHLSDELMNYRGPVLPVHDAKFRAMYVSCRERCEYLVIGQFEDALFVSRHIGDLPDTQPVRLARLVTLSIGQDELDDDLALVLYLASHIQELHDDCPSRDQCVLSCEEISFSNMGTRPFEIRLSIQANVDSIRPSACLDSIRFLDRDEFFLPWTDNHILCRKLLN